MKQTLERELKLEAPPGYQLPELPGTPIEPRRFTSTYFDSPDLILAGQHITLRRRVENRKGLWQLKIPRSNARLELEEPGGPLRPPKSMMNLLTAPLRGSELKPMAKIRTLRKGVVVQDEERGDIAEVVFDSAQVLQGGRISNRFTEIEIELLGAGNEADLKRIASTLKDSGARAGDQRPKAFRALNLVSPKPPEKRPDSDLARLQEAIGEQFKALLAADPGTRLGTDPEDLHDHRVAIRRLRSLLWSAKGLLEPEWSEGLRAELEWIGDQMNPVRDLDVMIPYLKADLEQLEPEEASSLEPFIAELEKEREQWRTTMLAALQTDRYLALLHALEEATRTMKIQAQESTLADGAVKAFRRMRRAANSMTEPLQDEPMHEVRRLAKKSRYSAEVVKGGGKKVTRFLEKIKELQDVLGNHQDAAVAEQRIKDYLPKAEGSAAYALGRMAERQSFKKHLCRKDFPDAWKSVESAPGAKLGCRPRSGGGRDHP